jgi:FkbM family methyltransferase
MQSYAQAGEDLAVKFTFDYLGIQDITYLDIGAYDATFLSNTYLFYSMGCRGTLVEPNPTLAKRLRKDRPRDTVIEAAVVPEAKDGASTVPFHEMSEPGWSTVDAQESVRMEYITKGKITCEKVCLVTAVTMQSLTSHYLPKVPNFVSLDAEGLDLKILQSIDFAQWRPQIFCVETLIAGTKYTNWNITQFMVSKNYSVRGGSLVNTLYVDNALL